jgi:hypothetical protein
MSNASDRPLRAFDVRVNDSNGSLLLVRGMDAYELRDVEADIWKLCDGNHTATEIAKKIGAEFDVEQDIAEADVRTFVKQLRDADLLE